MSLQPSKETLTKSPAPSHLHPSSSHHVSARPLSYLTQDSDALLLPEGSVSEEAVELLHEFVHPGHHHDKRRSGTEDTLVAEITESTQGVELDEGSDGDDEGAPGEGWNALKIRPWYRRPSPLWILCISPLSSIAMSACVAPRVELYTLLACFQHKPEYTTGSIQSGMDFYGNDELLSTTVTKNESMHLISDNVLLLSMESMPLFLVEGTMRTSKDTSKCASDPTVQAAAAKIIAVMTTTMGILSCLTTAFWGSLSDRYGRLRVLGLSVIGLLFNDFIFIFVYFFSRRLPGGYWFLLLGPVVEGILGGFTSMVAAVHAYFADCSAPGSRSRIFSLGLGLLFIGMALGPTVGALLIRGTHTTLSVFYLAAIVHALFALYVWAIVPESLPLRAQKVNRLRAARRVAEESGMEENETREQGVDWRASFVRMLGRTKRVFAFLSPLSVFAPKRVPVTPGTYNGKQCRDWSLTFIAASHGCTAFVMASYQYKFQYAAATFGWSSEEVGYWLSLVGGSRAFYLTVVLPLLIKVFNRPKQAIELPTDLSEPLLPEPISSEPSSSALAETASPRDSLSTTPHPPQSENTNAALTPHTPSFDLRLARCSLALEVVCFTLIPLAPSPMVFSVFGCLAAWGGGFGPAVQALALELYTRREKDAEVDRDGEGVGKDEGREVETGKLFGAMSVVQAMCSQIFGPTLFGITYIRTVARFPTAIFWVSTLCVALSMLFICLVRLPKDNTTESRSASYPGDNTQPDLENAPAPNNRRVPERETTLVDLSDGLDVGRNDIESGKVRK